MVKIMKPILTIKQKCKDCNGKGSVFGWINPTKSYPHAFINCNTCKGTGQKTKKIYALRDFEKCDCYCHYAYPRLFTRHNPKSKKCKCKGIGYIIPFKDYEIKSVERLQFEFATERHNAEVFNLNYALREHNLKEDDKVVIV